jgi:riboflavin synthase
MFTGIVEAVGEVVEISEREAFRRIGIRAPDVAGQIQVGSSVLTDGVCITACGLSEDGFVADLSRETLERTTFKHIQPGTRVNIEQAMSADSRFGGHIVQGHVDEVGRIARFDRSGDDWILEIAHDPASASRLVWKGSIAVDGISLTVAELSEASLSIAIIPFTLEHTNLQYRRPGDPVNLEFDVLAKYVEKLVAPYLNRLTNGLWDSQASNKPS